MRSGRKPRSCGWNCPQPSRAQGAELEALKAKLAEVEGRAAAAAVAADLERAESARQVTALTTELVTVKARAEAQAGVQADQAARLTRLEAELVQARAAAGAAREEAATLRGQAEALSTQHAELMQVLKDREGERPGPKGGKKP